MSAQPIDFNLRFNAESAEFSKDVEYAKKMLRGYTREAHAANDANGNLSRSLEKSADKAKAVGKGFLEVTGAVSAGVTAVAGATGYLITQQAEQARELERMATVAGINIELMQALGYASDQYNISGDKMADILKDVNDKLGDFSATGGGEFADFFENIAPKVGLTIQELQRMSGPEALLAIKEALDAANVPMKEQTFYLEAIANDASALVPLLENKGRKLYELTERYDRLNVSMSEFDVEKFKEMDQQLTDVGLKLERSFATAVVGARDQINWLTDELTYAVTWWGELFDGWNGDPNTQGGLINQLGDLRQEAKKTGRELSLAQQELTTLENTQKRAQDNLELAAHLANDKHGNKVEKTRAKVAQLQDELADYQSQIDKLQTEYGKRYLGLNTDPPPLKNRNSQDAANDDNGSETPTTEQDAGAAKLAMLDQRYADERTRLAIAHQTRLDDIGAMQLSEQEITRQGFETMAALKQEYRDREDEFYNEQVEAYTLRQDEQIQRELDAHQRKEDEKTRKSEKAAAERLAAERRIEQQMLSMKYGVASQGLALIEQTSKEGSAIQKAAFLAQKAMAAMQVWQQGEVAAMTAMAAPPIGLGTEAGSGYASAIRAMAAASAGMIMGQALAGMAHNGIDTVPTEGTWLLDKGERVYTNESARQIDMMYKTVMTMAIRSPANDPAFSAANRAVVSGGQYQFNMPIHIAVQEGTSPEQALQLGQGVRQLVLETLNNEKRPGGLLWAS